MSTHSYNKLELLLKTKDVNIKSTFNIDDYCVIIEAIYMPTNETFYIYIPSKYSIKPPDYIKQFNLNYVDNIESDALDLLNSCSENVDNYYLEKLYSRVDIDDGADVDEIKMVENYNNSITLKSLNVIDKFAVISIYKQIHRLFLCVKDINYKVYLRYKNYIAIVKYDNTIQLYALDLNNDFVSTDKCFHIVVDLKSFYERIDLVHNDIKHVKKNIYLILERNIIKNTDILIKLLPQLAEKTTLLIQKLQTQIKYVDELDEMLQKLNNKRKLIFEETKNTFDRKIIKIDELKKELINDITNNRSKQDTLILELDRIMFDNNLFVKQIYNNIDTIKALH